MDRRIFLQLSSNFHLEAFKFEGAEGGEGNPVFLWILVSLLAAALIAVAYLYITRRIRFREQALAREEARLRMMLTEAGLGAHDLELMQTLVESEDPADVIPLLSMRTLFEAAVEKFHEQYPDDPALREVPLLRQRLGYGFSNLRNPFTNTRMLVAGLRLQCTIPHPKRPVTFVTTVLAVREEDFLIAPPTAKGKPVSLANFPTLDFKASRENDAEYEFTAKILGQVDTGARAVTLEHTGSIRKLLYREAPRTSVSLEEMEFFAITQEVAAEKKHRVFKREESQYSLKGRMRDLSLGGLCIIVNPGAHKPAEGDLFVFRLPEAQIKDDLVAEVLLTIPRPSNELEIRLRLVGLKEINRLKLSRFLQLQGEQAKSEAPQASSSS